MRLQGSDILIGAMPAPRRRTLVSLSLLDTAGTGNVTAADRWGQPESPMTTCGNRRAGIGVSKT